jgi:hypothetical protein
VTDAYIVAGVNDGPPLRELADRDARRALAIMCIGVGQGSSVMIERA